MITIARIRGDLKTKFGVPRQSGLANALRSTIVFEPPYRNADSLCGLDGFSHIWLLWHFHQTGATAQSQWSPTVRPPRLGGNKRMGVFATRSPFRPNGIGLSSVRLTGVELSTPLGPVLHVEGADLVDGTPILDIKPYLAYTDSHPHATGGFTDEAGMSLPLRVSIPEEWRAKLGEVRMEALREILERDPRPQYHADPARIYVMEYAGMEVRFRVDGRALTVMTP